MYYDYNWLAKNVIMEIRAFLKVTFIRNSRKDLVAARISFSEP